jgi:3-mercaptopyruvate sulfurtransferase SseA
MLKRRGITRVHPLAGGLEQWKALGFPVLEVPEPELATLKARAVSETIVLTGR